MTAKLEARVWVALTPRRYFLLSDVTQLPRGELTLHAGGDMVNVDPSALGAFEISQDQAHRWTRAELGSTLTDLRASIDERLAAMRARLAEERHAPVAPDTTITPAAVPALLDFLCALPGIVGRGISGDEQRVAQARASLERLRGRLADGGIDLDGRFTGFADRLAALRREAASRGVQGSVDSSPGRSPNEEPGSSP